MFLLFLDCVAQLCYQCPADFEFSQIYLVRVWDSLCSGVFRTFSFNSIHDSQLTVVGNSGRRNANGVLRHHNSLFGFHTSVWDWTVQFNDAQIALNYDPLYAAKQGHDSETARVIVTPSGGSLPSNSGVKTTSSLKISADVLGIKLWSLCYLRWVSPLTIFGGGMASAYLAQCLLVEEIHSLRTKIAMCEANLSGGVGRGSSDRRRSMLVFGGLAVADGDDDADTNCGNWDKLNCSQLSELLPAVSSSFPFTDGRQDITRYYLSVDSYGEEIGFRIDYGAESLATEMDSSQNTISCVDDNRANGNSENGSDNSV